MKQRLLVALILSLVGCGGSADEGQHAEATAEGQHAEATATPAVPGDLASRPAELTCGRTCFPNEGGTTSTQEMISGAGCPGAQAALTTSRTAAANAACNATTGFNACNVVMHFSGCLYDGDPQYFIEYGWATYGCNDTTC